MRVTPEERPPVVIVDWNVTRTSPVGSSLLEILRGLSRRYRFVVVAAHFENPDSAEIEHVRVPLPRVPSFVKELCWPVIVGISFRLRRLGAIPGAVTRATQGQLPGAPIVSAHYCHRAYLTEYFATSGTPGLRRVSRFLVHRYSARLERKAFRRAGVITVPSRGLQREIERFYPEVRDKLVCIPNPVDTAALVRPEDFDRDAARTRLGFAPGDVVFVFVALGDFARKGLGVVIPGLAELTATDARVLVVGGTPGETALYRKRAEAAGVEGLVTFVGKQEDVRPYLWLADAFLFPTLYEAASKATLQAAAAGLPLLASRVSGIEDVIDDGRNGWFVERTPAGVAAAVRTALAARDELPELGRHAQTTVAPWDKRLYVERWDELFARVGR
jgi:glycosyltransferase involved in cell wall biosynthesis